MKTLDKLFKNKYDVTVSDKKVQQSVRYTVEVTSGNFVARQSLIHEDRDRAVELCLMMISDKIKRQKKRLLRYYPDVFSDSLDREEGVSFDVPYDVELMECEELEMDEAIMKLETLSLPLIVFRNSASGELTALSYDADGELRVFLLA